MLKYYRANVCDIISLCPKGFCKKVRMAGVLKPKQKFGMEPVLQSFSGFGIQRNSGNYLPNVLVVRVLSQLPILSLFPMEIVDTN